MNNSKQIILACTILLAGFMTNTINSHAQFAKLVDTGTTIRDITFTDINGNDFTLYSYLDQGYTVVIELALTTCKPCWAFKQEGCFERLYQQYGPEGSIKSKKILPIFIESNPDTDSDDLHGRGNNTEGDWVSGASYPIVDLTKQRQDYTIRPFFTQGMIQFGTPTFLVICPDRKLTLAGEGLGTVNDQIMVNLMENRCTAGGLNIGNTISLNSITTFPNPVTDVIHINFEAAQKAKAKISVSTVLGQEMMTKAIETEAGIQTQSMEIGTLSTGIYILSITTQKERLQYKFSKK